MKNKKISPISIFLEERQKYLKKIKFPENPGILLWTHSCILFLSLFCSRKSTHKSILEYRTVHITPKQCTPSKKIIQRQVHLFLFEYENIKKKPREN